MAADGADAGAGATDAGEPWLAWSIPADERAEILLRAEEAEITQMPPLPAFLAGLAAAVAVTVALLVATLGCGGPCV